MFVGIDVGGTNLKAGLVDGDGCLLAAARNTTVDWCAGAVRQR